MKKSADQLRSKAIYWQRQARIAFKESQLARIRNDNWALEICQEQAYDYYGHARGALFKLIDRTGSEA